jgi:hypothetical protein
LEPSLRSAILGNVGTLIIFRTGAEDAEYLARESYPVFNEADLVNLPQYHIYLKLLIDGVPSTGFSAVTLSLRGKKTENRGRVIEQSRTRYGRPPQIRSREATQPYLSSHKGNDAAAPPP